MYKYATTEKQRRYIEVLAAKLGYACGEDFAAEVWRCSHSKASRQLGDGRMASALIAAAQKRLENKEKNTAASS